MKVAIVKERRPYERRVAATPDSVKLMVGMGLRSTVETGAGAEAYFTDDAYSAAGATLVPRRGGGAGRRRHCAQSAAAAARRGLTLPTS